MTIIKFVLLILLLICLIVLQISFLPSFSLLEYLNLIFVLMVILLAFSQTKYAFLVALAGGVLLDLYSIFIPGLYLAALVITFIVSTKLIKGFSSITLLSVFALALGSNIVYQICILVMSWLAYFLNLQALHVIFSKFYWSGFCWSIFLNSLLVLGIFLVVKIASQSGRI